ncbi:hypothetical protein [Nesterenkonia muleiensis]|uniref:hypothetical protein n=1 Tax=Nesterenkonia muleiensis TaxID=2282648 RepID=UPI00130063DE|nr:hypothetical protein [Nesterenkonia muleiensis]
MSDMSLGSARLKTAQQLPASDPAPLRRSHLQRAALTVSAALAAWAEASARRQGSAAEPLEAVRRRSGRAHEAELGREAAINQRLLMPRQF